MSIPIRSVRLEKRTSRSLDILSGSSGEIFFDADQNTLRLYTANQADSVIMASREWVTQNTFSGNYNDLENLPVISSDWADITNKPVFASIATSGSYNDLLDTPDLSALEVDISTIDNIGDVDTTTRDLTVGHILQWDGTNWSNTPLAEFEDTNTTYSIGSGATAEGANIILTDSEGITTESEIVGGTNIAVIVNAEGKIEVGVSAFSLGDLSDTNITDIEDGQQLVYQSGEWVNVNGPPPPIQLSDFSVTTDAASGSGSLSYDNTTGVFTFAPADLSTLSSDLDLSGNNINGTGNIDVDGTITANSFNLNTGTPEITSESTITLTAPNGIVLDGLAILEKTTETITSLTGATGTVVHDVSQTHVFFHTGAVADFTANFTNLPTTNDRSTTVVLMILNSVGNAYTCNAVEIDGVSQDVLWQGGNVPTGNAGIDVVSFTLIRLDDAWGVIGNATAYTV